MTRTIALSALLVVGVLPVAATAAEHVTATPETLKWTAAPPAFPKGAQIAVVSGDPTKEGPYVVRLKLPAGYKVPAHMHPNDENVTVISGTFRVGMGDKLDDAKGETLKAGGFFHAPKGMPHYAMFPEETVIQNHGIGPSGINYVNPADDPRKSN
jgi:quercetin dioxygenase-like cupin family protein